MSVTAESEYNESLVAFFEAEVVGEADLMYRFALTYLLDAQEAFASVSQVYRSLAKNVQDLANLETIALRIYLLKTCMRDILKRKVEKSKEKGVVFDFLSKLQPMERAVFALVELAGLSATECVAITELEEVQVLQALAKAREQSMGLSL